MKINDLSKIIYFQVAAQFLSYTKAAYKLQTTPSSVQRSVKALEDSLGVKLFLRKSKGLALTPEGKMFLDRVNKITKELDLAESELALKQQKPTDKLKILTTLGLAADWVHKTFPILLSTHPALKIELFTSNVELSLETEEFDIYIGPKTEAATTYKSKFLTHLDFKLYASPGYIEKYGHPKNMEDLKNHKLIYFAGSRQAYFSETNEVYSGLGESDNYSFVIDYYLVECLLVEQGLGIASISKNLARREYPNFVDIFPHDKPITVGIYLYWLNKNLNAQVLKDLCDALNDTLPYSN